MRLLVLVLLAIAGLARASDVAYFVSPSVSPTNSVVVTNKVPRGQVATVSIGVTGGSATCRVYSASGYGLSKGASRTLMAPVVVTPSGLVTNIAATFVVWDDRFEIQVDNAAITSSVSASAIVVVKEP